MKTFFTGNFFYLLLLYLFCQGFEATAQTYPATTIDPWTTKSRRPSTYFKMVSWDSSPYKEYTYWKRTGPYYWHVTEYMNFRLLPPLNYDSLATDKKYPIVIMLHGAGESGIKWTGHFDYVNGYRTTPPEPEKVDNNDHHLLFGAKEHLDARNRAETHPRAFPGFVLFPQVQYNGAWAGAYDQSISNYNRQVIEIIEMLLTKYNIDPNRIYVHGLSNGAKGTWDLVNRRPDLFAAGLPMSGVGDASLMAEKLAHFPLWIFQGGKDVNPVPGATMQMVDALKGAGGSPRLTVYEDLGHGVWNKAYAEPDFFSWMLAQNKLNIHVYFGKTVFATNETINAKLGISPGFNEYTWQKDNIVIPNSNSNQLVATSTGAYQVRFRRGNDWTDWSKPVHIIREGDLPQELSVLYRINAGYSALTAEPMEWSTDMQGQKSPYFNSTSVNASAGWNNFSYLNTTNAPNELFGSQRIGYSWGGPIQYNFPVNGPAQVSLYFAERSNQEVKAVGQRVFNISIEGANVLENLDIFAEAGRNALKKTFDVTVSDGSLDIILNRKTGNPIISGIEVKGLQNTSSAYYAMNNDLEMYNMMASNMQNDVGVYPNPFKTDLYIRLPYDASEVESVTVLNPIGEVVFQKSVKMTGNDIVVQDLNVAPGLYQLTIKSKRGDSKSFKIIKE